LVIGLSLEGRRRIAALSLPTTQVHFTFSGYSQQDIEQFMARFDRAFQRGGGRENQTAPQSRELAHQADNSNGPGDWAAPSIGNARG